MDKHQKAQARTNALRANLKKRKAFIKDSAEAALSNNGSKKDTNAVAVGGGTEEDALKEES